MQNHPRCPRVRHRVSAWALVACSFAAGSVPAVWSRAEPDAVTQHAASPEASTPWPGPLQPDYTPLFRGVGHATLVIDRPPLRQVVNVLRVDLDAPGIAFTATPGNADAPLETDGQTCTAFLASSGAQAAINTHFFGPCCDATLGQPKDLIGLAVADGQLVSPHPAAGGQRDVLVFGPALDPDTPGWDAFFVPGAGEISSVAGDDAPPWLADTRIALAGTLVRSCGSTVPRFADQADDAPRHPRTAIGLSKDGRTLLLITVDGRQPLVSHGVTMGELASLGEQLGAWYVLNVDGGGSTTMAVQNTDGRPKVLNTPSGGGERVNGSHLGVLAQPLDADPKPAPESEPAEATP